ncbi:MAG: biotin--[acetyl-CoA-carboxylase] ligase, partial [Parasporobacterium sp.]|nr:biotin--[acetyl-CoA-carboxylase] ligase [Parasporobacterium sp.]
MTTKEQLAILLENNEGNFISGSVIARELDITRAAVWKAIRQLQDEGYDIEAVNNKGYRLGNLNDVLSVNKIMSYLGEDACEYQLECHRSISSTNTYLKQHEKELPDWYTVISECQDQGRGRRGRTFYSPAGTGIYMSTLIRLPLSAADATHITTAAAVAICRSIEECTDSEPGIKWVNDVFVNGRKICGILTEASISMESQSLDWVVMGIGINVYEPEGGFPEEIKDIAGSIVLEKQKDLRSRLAA